jgi:hypothetical protein
MTAKRCARLVSSLLVAGTLLGSGLVGAQDVGIEQRPGKSVVPGEASATTPSPPAAGREVGRDHAPAFVEPFVGAYETPTVTGRFGLSGWTTANPPPGPPYRDATGWFTFGFTFTWDPKPPTATP